MNPIEQSLEQRLSEEQVQRQLLELYQDEDWTGLLAKAELLNAAWHFEASVTKWLAKEAADNLTKGWQTATSDLSAHDSPDC